MNFKKRFNIKDYEIIISTDLQHHASVTIKPGMDTGVD